jgi:hypothetical protein
MTTRARKTDLPGATWVTVAEITPFSEPVTAIVRVLRRPGQSPTSAIMIRVRDNVTGITIPVQAGPGAASGRELLIPHTDVGAVDRCPAHGRVQRWFTRDDKRGYVYLGTVTTTAIVIWLRT